MIAVNVLYHEDTEYRDNKKQSCCYASNPHVKWNPLFKGHTILVHAILTNTMFIIVYVHLFEGLGLC
jgi:quinol-cytochrome oxidoreductase complex cytochrome b subunit